MKFIYKKNEHTMSIILFQFNTNIKQPVFVETCLKIKMKN